MKTKIVTDTISSSKTIGEAFQNTRAILKHAGFTAFESDTEALFGYLLRMNKSDIYIHHARKLTRNEVCQLQGMLDKRLKQVPIQYITHRQEFMGLNFYTQEEVLIPRSETEILVEKVLELLNSNNSPECLKIIDLGTGTGIIAVSIAYYFKNVIVFATDISEKAIGIAQKNAMKHQCMEKITFLSGNLFKVFENRILTNNIDGIVANPPYIPKNEIQFLPDEIKEHEPHIALNGGIEGLDYFLKIIQKSCDYLKKDGFLAMEMGIGQAKKIKKILLQNETYNEKIEIIKDYSGVERVIVAYKK